MHDPDVARFWLLDRTVDFLNHGSFGACPIPVLEAQHRLRERLERQPVLFLDRELEERMVEARRALGAFIGADGDDLVSVPNATTGVNTVVRSLRFRPGDEVVVTNQTYPACRNAFVAAAELSGASARIADVPFPIAGPREVTSAILRAVTPRTRLVLLDHVTSPTGAVWPVKELVSELESRGVDALIDGAHAPGMLPLRIDELGAAYYTGNCHKWLSAPKGAAFLHVRKDRQDRIRPLVISHGATSDRTDVPRFRREFDWTGTQDVTAFLSVPEAIGFLGSLFPGGWEELMRRNREKAIEARRVLCEGLGIGPPCPEEMIGSLAAVPLPDGDGSPPRSKIGLDPLQDELWEQFRIEVPVFPWPTRPKRLLRISAQVYNRPEQYIRLAEALGRLLTRTR